MLTVARLAGRRLGVPLPSERARCAADASLLPANGRCGARVAAVLHCYIRADRRSAGNADEWICALVVVAPSLVIP